MKVLLRYKSYVTQEMHTEEIEAKYLPAYGDTVMVDGARRKVQSRTFHMFGAKGSGNWINRLFRDAGPYVEIKLYG